MTISPFDPLRFPRYPLNNITPFTYRDGRTFLELIEGLKNYINEEYVAAVNALLDDLNLATEESIGGIEATFNSQLAAFNTTVDTLISETEGEIATLINETEDKILTFDSQVTAKLATVNTAITDMTTTVNNAVADMNENATVQIALVNTTMQEYMDDISDQIALINEKTGPVGAQFIALTQAHTVIEVSPLFPPNHELTYVFTQNATGDRRVTFDPAVVSGTVLLNPAPRSTTTVKLTPLGNGKYRVMNEVNRLGSWEVNSDTKRNIVDNAKYNAFPSAVRTKLGYLFMAYGEQDTHYTGSMAKSVYSNNNGASWSPARSITAGGVANVPSCVSPVVIGGEKIAAIAFLLPDQSRKAYLVTTDNYGMSWTTESEIIWSGSGWKFPNHLYFDNGVYYATCYGANGVLVSKSFDGKTWEPLSIIATGTLYSETCITRCDDGTMFATLRWESGTTKEIRGARSLDDGKTWSNPVTLLSNASGLPQVKRMSDGTLLMPFRDTSNLDGWSYASSRDSGHSWSRHIVGNMQMMYGDFVEIINGRALLFGASQERSATTNADIWLMDVNYNNINLKNDVGWTPLALEAGYTASTPPMYRIKNGIVYFEGITSKDAPFTTGDSIVCILPEHIRPKSQRRFTTGHIITTSDAYGLVGLILSNGKVAVYKSSSADTTLVDFSEIPPYPVGL